MGIDIIATPRFKHQCGEMAEIIIVTDQVLDHCEHLSVVTFGDGESISRVEWRMVWSFPGHPTLTTATMGEGSFEVSGKGATVRDGMMRGTAALTDTGRKVVAETVNRAADRLKDMLPEWSRRPLVEHVLTTA